MTLAKLTRVRKWHIITIVVVALWLPLLAFMANLPAVRDEVIARGKTSQIIAAVKQFRTEYGDFPVVGKDGLIVSVGENAQLFRILCGIDGDQNRQRISFFHDSTARPKRLAFKRRLIAGFDPATGALLDPWGTAYCIGIDIDNDGNVVAPYDDDPAGRNIPTRVVAWSVGRDGHQGTRENPRQFNGSDDIISWR